MLDPRIYRTGLIAVVLAVIVFAFSLDDQPGPVGATLAPEAFNGANAYATMTSLARRYPSRRPGSRADDAVAGFVAQRLRHDGLTVTRSSFTARTVDGRRRLENVTGVLAGLSTGSIVVVAHRDALGSPATSELSGTGVLLDLGRVLVGETHQRSIVLASTSGSAGDAGALRLARSLGGPVDAVIVLGDLAGRSVHRPIVVPWSNGQRLAPPRLRNTVVAALGAQAGLAAGTTSLASQFIHLAFPVAVSEQGPFGRFGDPAVLLSLSGERTPAADEPVSATRIGALGRSVLQTVNALDGGPDIPAPSAYLILDGKMIPDWAIRLLVLALMLPVVAATIDGVARVRRRHHPVARWLVWVLAGAVPFALAVGAVLLCRVLGLIKAAPPGPVSAGAVPIHASGAVTLAITAIAMLVGLLALRPLVIRAARGHSRDFAAGAGSPGAGAALLLVLSAVGLVMWFTNPFAAVLIVPALHFWLWAVAPQERLRAPAILLLVLLGLAAPVLALLYYAGTLGLSPLGLAWNWVLMLAGGDLGVGFALQWSIALGCLLSVVVIGVRLVRQPRRQDVPITVRGPVTYAGPGSLGGTHSALRR